MAKGGATYNGKARTPAVTVSLLTRDELDMGAIEQYVHAKEDKIETIRILLGPCGDSSFRYLLEEEIVKQWCRAMGIERSMLNDDDQLFLRYSIGGMASLYAMKPGDQSEPLDYAAGFKLVGECVLPHVKRMIKKYVP
ncbi:MAG: hypothetical protein ACI36Y_03280 [Coriobacteriales bacterium]